MDFEFAFINFSPLVSKGSFCHSVRALRRLVKLSGGFGRTFCGGLCLSRALIGKKTDATDKGK